MRVAAIDIGTNTAQLLIAAVEGMTIRRRHVAERFVRLGEGVDSHGRIGTAAKERLLSTLREYQSILRDYGVEQRTVAGTSALRDATNRDAVLGAVRDEMGWTVDLLSGAEEAAWSFAAACDAFEDLTGPILVVDIGGGSIELVAGTNPAAHRPAYPRAIHDRTSLQAGCVRLTERHVDGLPPSTDAIGTVESQIDGALQDTNLTVGPDPVVVGTAGTASALALLHAGPERTWNPREGGGFTLTREAIHHWRTRLLGCSVDEVRALHPSAMEGRADVFPVGVLLLDRIVQHIDANTLRVSPYELRHGLVLRQRAAGA
jgi:exopolyphosphatase/guanosine-5'-triphosphate,3'-diphosphate pyrophosphatase